jgi:3-oxoacyl-[acyl-carrier protein] reductase
MDLGLRGRRALVMGGSKGLGRSIADALAGEGTSLVVSGRDQASLDQVAAALREAGAERAVGIPADVDDLSAMDRLAEGALAALGGIDIVVLNHGGPPPGPAVGVKEADIETWFRRMVLAPLRVANRLIPGMRERKWGRIITVGSAGMVQPLPNMVLSNMLRASIVGWNKTLSAELAPEGITCNILAPGSILTDRTRVTVGAMAERAGIPYEEMLKQRAATIPAGRAGQPDEYGPMGAFLASDKASYMTGTIVRVDGGMVRSF